MFFDSDPNQFKMHSDTRVRVHDLRTLMAQRNPNQVLSAYIVPSYDDHQNEDVADCDKRREYISGFSGLRATVVITQKSLALWTTERYLAQANSEVDCDWTIFDITNSPSITDWISVGGCDYNNFFEINFVLRKF